MSVEVLKYILQPVAYERDDETGRVVRELPGQTVAVFSAQEAVSAIEEFEAQLQRLQQESNGAQASQR